MAVRDGRKIVRLHGKVSNAINHFVSGLVYCAMCMLPYLFFDAHYFHWVMYYNPLIFLSLLLNRSIVFDIALNLYRKRAWDYISPRPYSIVDKLEYWIFGDDGKFMFIVYGTLYVLNIVAFYLFPWL
jgi:hypothetical protein